MVKFYYFLIFINASALVQADSYDPSQSEFRHIKDYNKPILHVQQQIQNLNSNLIHQATVQQLQKTLQRVHLQHACPDYYPTLASFYNHHKQDLYSVMYNWFNDTPSVSYFAGKFDHLSSLEVFHQFYHYQDPN